MWKALSNKIDVKLSFYAYIDDIYERAAPKLNDLSRIDLYLDVDKKKILWFFLITVQLPSADINVP